MVDQDKSKVYVLYENIEWLEPLAIAMDKKGIPMHPWTIIEGGVDMTKEPPKGVFFNRLSASAHTRGHTGSVSLGGAILSWLEGHGARVINGRSVIDLEVRKFDQYMLLKKHGIAVPRTVATTGREALSEAAQSFGGPFIVKPNRGGKGLGVRLFQSVAEMEAAIEAEDTDFASEDGIQLVQQYIKAKEPKIMRNEFIGGEHVYSVAVDTSQGFELCPADADSCEVGALDPNEKFKIMPGYDHPLAEKYKAVMKEAGIEVAALESIEAEDGTIYTYDINTNTNYNQTAETAQGVEPSAYDRLADFLGDQLKTL